MKRILVFVCLVLLSGTLASAEYAAADRFVNNNDGTVTDTQTGLMWADQDNGSGIHWPGARSYCEGYSKGGKSGWRMPTIAELKQLHSSGAYGSVIKKTSSFVWSSETKASLEGKTAYIFNFRHGSWYWVRQSGVYRALPVRSGN